MFLYLAKCFIWLNFQYYRTPFSWLFMFLSWLDNCLLELCDSVYNCISHARETIPNQICCMVVARLEEWFIWTRTIELPTCVTIWWSIKAMCTWLMIDLKGKRLNFNCHLLFTNFILICDREYFTCFRFLWLIPSICIQ